MKSSKDLFIEQREAEAINDMNQLRRGKDVPAYKKFIDVNEETERMMSDEMENDFFANDLYERESGGDL